MKLISKLGLLAGSLAISSSSYAGLHSVCERTPAVAEFIVKQINKEQGTSKTCSEIDEDDLLSLKRVSVARKGIQEFRVGDFAGLGNLEILNIRSNPAPVYPEGLFAGLTNLKTLVIIGSELRYYPDDFLQDTPNLENCHCFRNQVRSISASVLERLRDMDRLEVLDFDRTLQDAEKEALLEIFPEGGAVQLFFR